VTPSNAYRIVILAVIVLFAVQFHSQKKFFNSFNAVVPSAWFYPVTPSIQYVKERLKPLQSVIADEAFLGSGTLGAYGIAEWYAHSFKTDREKEVLRNLVDDPFVTPTAAIIRGNKIHYFSPLMDKLAIKYLLLNKRLTEREDIIDVPGPPLGLTKSLPDHSWKQHLSLPEDMVIGYVGFNFTTYGGKQAPADVRLTVFDSDGTLHAESELSRHRVADNRWAYFKFPKKVFFEKGKYSMVLSLVDHTGPDKLAAAVTRDQKHIGRYLEIDGIESGTSLLLRIAAYEKMNLAMFERKWNVLDLESDIVVFENKKVTNSAYFVDDLNAANERLDFSGLEITQPSSDLITINYTKGQKGWIVLPMHLHSGWKAYVDEQQVDYDTYLGIMPAIPVHEAGQVVFKYQPGSFRRGVIVSVTGFFIFLILSAVCFQSDKERNVVP
jgi:hypothetical protein